METTKEEIVCMETNVLGNVRSVACIGPPKRLAQTIVHARQSDVLRFASDQWGIDSSRRFVEATEEEELTLEKSISASKCWRASVNEWK